MQLTGDNKATSRKIKNKLQYVTQSYYFTLSASTHGKDQIDIDFFNIAEGVFPELQREKLKNLKKTCKEWEVPSLLLEGGSKGEMGGDYEFDISVETKDGFFVVKHFKKDQVSFEDVREAIITAKDGHSSRKGIFRMVCLANSFSKDVVDRHKDLEKSAKRKVPLDLIAVREKGFSVVKISRLHSED